jgi:hypothetical protein
MLSPKGLFGFSPLMGTVRYLDFQISICRLLALRS